MRTARISRRPAGRSAQRPDRDRRRRGSAGPHPAHRDRQRRRQAQHRNAAEAGPRLCLRPTSNFDEDLALGYIPIDSVHSPVRKVNYTVEAARLGQMTDYDKLTLEVWTNGAISPQDAIGQAAKLLKDHMAIFINFEEVPEAAGGAGERAINQMNEILNRSVEELELSVRSYNCLKNANIQTIGDLVQKTEAEMLRTKNFGRKSLNEIKEILQNLGLGFGMKFDSQGRLIAPQRTAVRLRPGAEGEGGEYNATE